jgi:hypothetical protein
MATSGDLDLAAHGDLIMAMDIIPSRHLLPDLYGRWASSRPA